MHLTRVWISRVPPDSKAFGRWSQRHEYLQSKGVKTVWFFAYEFWTSGSAVWSEVSVLFRPISHLVGWAEPWLQGYGLFLEWVLWTCTTLLHKNAYESLTCMLRRPNSSLTPKTSKLNAKKYESQCKPSPAPESLRRESPVSVVVMNNLRFDCDNGKSKENDAAWHNA
jgi:hypothetical protein